MKWSFASVGLIMLGLFGIVIIMLFNDITVSNEQDYYTLKYATEASMLESVDVAYYRLTGEIKISQEKFIENFTRRFTETSTFGQGNYDIVFYQINETPPKVSLRIYDKTSGYNIYTYTSDVKTTQVNVVNELSAILEGEVIDKDKNGYEIKIKDSSIGKQKEQDNSVCELKVSIGINKNTGSEIYRCVHPDGTSEYQEGSGKIVAEAEVNMEVTTPIESNELCSEGTLKIVGTLKSNNEKYAFSCANKNGQKMYKDESNKTIPESSIYFFSENLNNCEEKKIVGKVKNSSVVAYKCDLITGASEYQDFYGHRISSDDIDFN